MKLKYYLRGAGLGIIFATLIMMLSCSLHNNSMSKEDIIKEAEKLGMVMPETETQQDTASNESELPKDNNETKEPESDTESTIPPQETEPVHVTISVQRGWGTRKFSEAMLEQGIITDAAAFEKVLIDTGVGAKLMVGDYVFPAKATHEELIEIIRVTNEKLIHP